MRLCLDLMVGQEDILCDQVPWLTIVMALLVPLHPVIIVVKLSTYQGGSRPFSTCLEDPS